MIYLFLGLASFLTGLVVLPAALEAWEVARTKRLCRRLDRAGLPWRARPTLDEAEITDGFYNVRRLHSRYGMTVEVKDGGMNVAMNGAVLAAVSSQPGPALEEWQGPLPVKDTRALRVAMMLPRRFA